MIQRLQSNQKPQNSLESLINTLLSLFMWVKDPLDSVLKRLSCLSFLVRLRVRSRHYAMSLLDKLWDDTVAGPRPDSGLGKLRKYSTFSSRTNSGKESSENRSQSSAAAAAAAPVSGDDAVKVTRSIMIVRPPQLDLKDSPPVSPAGSTPPVSPFSGGSGREAYRFRRRSGSFSYEKANGIGPHSPRPPYL